MLTKFYLLIKASRFLLFFAVLWIAATSVSKGENVSAVTMQLVTLSEENATLSQLIWKMKQQTGVIFAYSTEDISGVVIPSFHVTNEPVYSALSKCLKNTNLECDIVEDVIVIKKKDVAPILQQQKQQPLMFTIRGNVKDEAGDPLIGVAVLIKGSTHGGSTDVDGDYVIENVRPGEVIVVSYIGKETIEQKIVWGKSVMNIILKDKVSVLDDVVVTGYQTISKERATGSYTILSSKEMENKTQTGILSIIEGMVPGMSRSGNVDNGIRIRGTTSLNATKTPLYIVDGVPYTGNVGFIHPKDIAKITVLKDAAATSIYGASAANGVIVISTRKGETGKTKVSYNGSIHFSEVASLDHLDLINSAELVEFQLIAFNAKTPSGYALKDMWIAQSKDPRKYMDPIHSALVAHDQGQISEAELSEKLIHYASLDNRGQIYDAFSRTALTHQHNLSVNGGSEKYKFYVSMNYIASNPHDKYSNSSRYGINTKNEFIISPKLTAYVNLSTTAGKSKSDNFRTASYSGLLLGYPSYQMLRDTDGTPLAFPGYGTEGYLQKSQYEIDRLISVGLYDQTYYPEEDMHKATSEDTYNYLRIQGGFNWKIFDGLSASAIFQQETNNSKNKEHFLVTSYAMRNHINDAAQIDPLTNEITYNIPVGGRLNESRSDSKSYTLRGQLDFIKLFGEDHMVTALAGAERRATRGTSSSMVLLGYTENGMSHTKYDPYAYSYINGTESLLGSYNNYTLNNGVNDWENKYVSFYGNASYCYKERYDVSGSIRVDESNLFARTADNKWKPIWSVGAGWHIAKESFMNNAKWIDRLTLRLTYGIGGNMAPHASAFTVIYAQGADYFTKLSSAYIREPANPQLSWEKTTTKNVGLDFAVLGSRITGSVDYYKKHTTNLYGKLQSDPTIGWDEKLTNYGKMDNQGVEIALNATAIKSRDFAWNLGWVFGYNKNKLIEVDGTEFVRDSYLYTPEVLVAGKPLETIYSPRYAKLNNKGVPLFYNRDNELVDFQDLDTEDLVCVGTSEPKYTMSFINSLAYKEFELSFKLMYYGGHVLRDQRQTALSGFEATNFNRKALNFWMEPGDELDHSKSPALDPQSGWLWGLGWLTRDTNVKKANYLKLRNVNLSYRVPNSALSQFKIEQMTLAFQVDNLLTWTANGNIDPESYYFSANGSYSISMRPKPNFSFSVNINF